MRRIQISEIALRIDFARHLVLRYVCCSKTTSFITNPADRSPRIPSGISSGISSGLGNHTSVSPSISEKASGSRSMLRHNRNLHVVTKPASKPRRNTLIDGPIHERVRPEKIHQNKAVERLLKAQHDAFTSNRSHEKLSRGTPKKPLKTLAAQIEIPQNPPPCLQHPTAETIEGLLQAG